MAVSIACVSGKGRGNKPPTCSALARAIAERGKRVLAVDMDPQSHLTLSLGQDPSRLERTVADLLVDPVLSLDQVSRATEWPNLSLLPANSDVAAAEQGMPTTVDRRLALRETLARGSGLAGYDIVILDAPPTFGFHTLSVLTATDFVLIPVQMSGSAIKGLKEVLRTVHSARQGLNPELRVLGVVPILVNMQIHSSREMLEGIREIPDLHIFDAIVQGTVKLPETALAEMPISASASSSDAAAAHRHLAGEILEHV
ncbi:MAG: ParA family protein [Candidatus Dormibacteria bacterium]